MEIVRVNAGPIILPGMPRPPTRPATPFGQYLVDAAIRVGHSDITSWGESLGIKASAISDYRCGRRNPNDKALIKWAKSLNLTDDQLTVFYIYAAAERCPNHLRAIIRGLPSHLKTLQSRYDDIQGRVLALTDQLQARDATIKKISARLDELEGRL